MTVAYSLDDIVRTSDEAAVQARFSAATLTALRVFAFFFLFAGLPHLIQAKTLYRRMLGLGSVVVAVATIAVARRSATNRVAEYVRGRARGFAMAFLVAEAAFLILHNANAGRDAAVVFAILIPMLAIFYRLLPAEHVLLHSLLAGVAIVGLLTLSNPKEGLADVLIPPLVTNASSLFVALWISRRVRRRIVREWTEKRTSAREQIRMRDELLYARELQLSMLPECAPSLDWADICSISIPAFEVGGDYYDYFVADDHLALVSGDVAGHGMSSGLVLAALRGGFTLLRDSLRDPAAVLTRLHDLVAQTTRRRMLVTVSVVLLDRTTRRATIASAGHPPVIIRRANGSVETINLYAPPLGVRLPLHIPQRQIEFGPGDVFILHSDGVYETRNAADEVYGLDRLERIVGENGTHSAEELRDAILRDVAAFRGSQEQDDDLTLVICRMR